MAFVTNSGRLILGNDILECLACEMYLFTMYFYQFLFQEDASVIYY